MCRRMETAISSYSQFYVRLEIQRMSTNLIIETTPPRRIVSVCSVNGVNFAIGYSSSELDSNGSIDPGVRKNKRPLGVW